MEGNIDFDNNTYETVWPYLKTMLETGIATGRGLGAFNDFVLDKHGARFLPYLQQFLSDIYQGKITIQGLGH